MEPVRQAPEKPRRIRQFDWPAIAAMCRNDPGEFYLIGRQIPHSTAAALGRGAMKDIPMDEFEYATENTTFTDETNGRFCDLFVKYVGPAGQPPIKEKK